MSPSSHRFLPLLGLLSLGILTFGRQASAANSSWTGTTSTNWSVGTNWGTAAASGNTLEFGGADPTGTTLNNDITAATSFGTITFDSGAPAFTINGNSITLTGNVTNNSTSLQTINLGIATTATRTFTMTPGGGNITLGGNITGSGGGVKTSGTGTLILSGNDSYTGNTTVGGANTSNTLSLTGTLSGGTAIAVNSGGLFSVAGAITGASAISVASGGILSEASGGSIGNAAASLSTSGTAILNGVNSYTGNTTVSGVLDVNNASALGSGTLTFSGNNGVLDNTSGAAITGQTNNPPIYISTYFNYSTAAGTANNNLNLGNGPITITFGNPHAYLNGTGDTLTFSGTLTTSVNTNMTFDVVGAGDTLVFGGLNLTTSNTNVSTTDTFQNNGNITITGQVANGGSGNDGLSYAGTGIMTLGGSNSYTGITTLSTAGTIKALNVNSLGANTGATAVSLSGGGTLSLLNDGSGNNGTIIYGAASNPSGYNVTITGNSTINVDHGSTATGNTIQFNALATTGNPTITITNGDGYNLKFAGGMTLTGSPTFTDNMANGTTTITALTNNGSGAPTFTFNGTSASATTSVGAITQPVGTLTVTQAGVETLDLTGSNTYTGNSSFNLGTTILDASSNSGASMAGSVISVASGATPTASAGNATLLVKGNYTIGTAGSPSLTIKGGNTGGTPLGQGTLSMVDGTINTLNINSATAAATVLTLAGASGNSSILNMEIGNNSSDTITLGSGLKASIGLGGVVLNLTGIGGFTSGASTQTLTLITAPGGGLTAGATNFTGNFTNGNYGGYTIASLSNSTTTALVLSLSGLTAAPGSAYWTGTQATAGWNVLSGGTNNNSNWSTSSGGTTDTHQVPGSTTNVFFAATGASNLTTSLGVSSTINSLTFNTASAVTISGANLLNISAGSANGNTLGNGITVNAGAGADTINGNIVLGSSQTWTQNSANALTVNGNISGGSNGLTVSGTGDIILGGTASYTGGLTINNGTVTVGNSAALNPSTPDALSFGAGTTSGKLQTFGQSFTIANLSTNAASPGTAIVENGGSANSTLTVSPSTSGTFAGVLQDGGGAGTLGLTMAGTGTLTLGGANTYSGPTTVAKGTLLVNGTQGANSTVTVTAAADNTTALLGGTGLINGAVVISATSGNGRTNEITGGSIGNPGTLTLAGGLTLNAGAVDYYSGSSSLSYLNITGGIFSASTGAIIEVPQSLLSGVYPLIGYGGTFPTIGNFSLEYQNGNAVGSNYTLAINGGVLDLDVQNATKAIPGITIATPLGAGGRVMIGQTVAVSGTINNSGAAQLNGTLADNGGALTIGSLSPSNPIVLGTGASSAYSGSVNTGSNLGLQSISAIVTDTNASPTSAQASTSLDVLNNRVVTASTVPAYGTVHVGTVVSGTTTLTSPGLDANYTRVTVANASADAYGISVTGGTNPVFNGSASDTRTVSGTFTTLGVVNGAITLVTTGEGLVGESASNVTVNYSAQVFSGKAAWSGTGVGTSWGTNGNWGDTQSGDLGGAGAPGVSGALSIGDTATFGDLVGESGTTNITLDGASPTLASITFTGTGTSYNIQPGTGGTITLQSATTSIIVSGTHTIGAILAGNGLAMSGSGTLVLAGANTYSGATTVANGVLELATGDNRLPATTSLTLGDPVANTSAQLVMGGTSARSQILAALTTAGTGTANSIVAGLSGTSTLTINNAATDTFSGTLGGAGTNQNSIALVKTGAGTLVLTGNNTYSGGTTLSAGTLNLGSAGAIGSTGLITFNGGTLQFSSSNTLDYSSRFTGIGNSAYSLDTNGQNVTIASPLLTDGGAAQGLTKNGLGMLTIASGNTYLGATIINLGVLFTPDMTTQTVNISGGVWEPVLTGSTLYAPTIGNSGAGALKAWTGGGFAAYGGKLTVNVNGGASLNWGSNSFMAAGTAPMIMSATNANNMVEFQNNFDFGGATGNLSGNFNRVIDVEGYLPVFNSGSPFGISGGSALLSGTITANVACSGSGGAVVGDVGNDGFVKTGGGTLILSASNTYSGPTTINNGTLVAGANALTGTAGPFGDGHTTVNSTTLTSVAGTQSITLGGASVNSGDGTAATNGSPTVLIGGPFTVQVPITIANIATTGTYGIGGSTDNPATFSGNITTNQSFTVYQAANTGTNALNITGNVITAQATVKTLTFANAGNVNVSGTLANAAGVLNVTQAGSGVTTISSYCSYTGTTTVNAGELVVSGGLTGTPTVIVGAAGQLNTAQFGSIPSNSTTTLSGILSGDGSVGNVNVQSGGTVSPGNGNTIGTLTAANSQFFGGGTFKLKLNDDGTSNGGTDGYAGLNWDEYAVNTLNLSSATLATTPFVLTLQTLDGSSNPNPLTSFDPTQSHTWADFVSFFNLTGTFASSDFTVNSANFLNSTNGGTFSVIEDPSNLGLDLVFTPTAVPEPGTWAMFIGGVGMLIGIRRFRRRN